MKPSEQDVAAVVVAHLAALGADIYEEVTIPGGVADIVARVGAELWLIEVKTSLSLALIVQAYGRRHLAHRTWVAAPCTRGCQEADLVIRELGLGLMICRNVRSDEAPHASYEAPRVDTIVDARRLTSKRCLSLAKRLQPEHKTHAKAGAVGGGGRWTPFRSTCEQLARIVTGQPGISLKEAISTISHHYASDASARGSIVARIESGLVPGVRMERDGKLLRLQPAVSP